jgi:hypothetical protein
MAGLLLGAAARAEDDGVASRAANAGEKKADTKADGADAAKTRDAKPGSVTKSGKLAEKPVNAADGVLAVLKVYVPGKSTPKGRKAKAADADTKDTKDTKDDTLNLMAASADVAVKLKELTLKSAFVDVTGVVTGDVMKITDVTQTEDKSAADKKPKSRRKPADQ